MEADWIRVVGAAAAVTLVVALWRHFADKFENGDFYVRVFLAIFILGTMIGLSLFA